MSSRNRTRKQRLRKYSGKQTTKVISKSKRKSVMTKQYSSSIQDKPNINNVFPGSKYKVISKPEKWIGGCRFEGQTGQCMGTDRGHGAKLKFISGEIVAIPFENIELHDECKYKKSGDKLSVVAVEPEKGKYYKVVKKPTRWNISCKYVNQIGLCILVDDRGARLRFFNGDDISFEAECLIESDSVVDLNNLSSEITEDSVQIGSIYRVIKKVEKYGIDAEKLVGKVGKSKWANYRGVCMKFTDTSSYVIPFDCLEKYHAQEPPNPVKIPKTLDANNIVIHRKYKVIILNDYVGDPKILGKLGKVIWASAASKGALLRFDDGYERLVPFPCLEDLPRPTENELVILIMQHPERILRMIKGLNKVTKLRPVMDFVQSGRLPEVEAEIPPEAIYGPNIPTCHSEALSMPCAGSVGEVVDGIFDRVVAMINDTDSCKSNTVATPVEEVAAED